MKISFVVPIYNEEKGFRDFYTKMLLPELEKIKYDYELTLVDDGSSDGSLKIIQDLAGKRSPHKGFTFLEKFWQRNCLDGGHPRGRG